VGRVEQRVGFFMAGIKDGKADAWWWWLVLKCIRPRLIDLRYKWDISMMRVASTGTKMG